MVMKTLQIFAAGLAMFAVAACQEAPSALTQANLDKIEEGMGAAQVKAILGNPTDSKTEPIPVVGGEKTTYYYNKDGAEIVIVMKNDNVQSKEGHFSSEKKE